MYKVLLVHLDASERSQVRLTIAVDLARRFQARLVGVFAQLDHAGPNLIAGRPSEAMTKATATARDRFARATNGTGLRTEWYEVPRGDHAAVVREVVIASRFADLSVLGQYDPEGDRGHIPSELVEEVILHSGGPALVIPYAGDVPTPGRHVLVAWNGSREAARALRDSLPLLAAAEEVRVISMIPRDAPAGLATHPTIVERLMADGIHAQAEALTPEDIGVMDLLLSRCTDAGADLAVMGGHGHYGFPYLNRGAGTRHILRHMTVPFLIAH